MTSIKSNLNEISKSIFETAQKNDRNPENIMLIAVSKRKSAATIREAIDAGAANFGENYIQEAIGKIDDIGKNNVCWHFIGHLQSNKAKFAVKYFDYIHTVDSVKLTKEIDKQARRIDKIQKILLQVNISKETTKSGTTTEGLTALIRKINRFKNISVQGLMCMPPYFSDPEDARRYFKKLVLLKEKILDLGLENISMNHLSMGMSNDYKVAIAEGSTMVRVGTSIFGVRD